MADTRLSIADKRRAFQQLHKAGCFVIPNPWDVGSARFLRSLGFKALATTSSGFAWSQWASELTVRHIAGLGVRRISVGGALARSAWGGFMRTARLIAEQGRFDGFADAASGKDLNSFFRE